MSKMELVIALIIIIIKVIAITPKIIIIIIYPATTTIKAVTSNISSSDLETATIIARMLTIVFRAKLNHKIKIKTVTLVQPTSNKTKIAALIVLPSHNSTLTKSQPKGNKFPFLLLKRNILICSNSHYLHLPARKLTTTTIANQILL